MSSAVVCSKPRSSNRSNAASTRRSRTGVPLTVPSSRIAAGRCCPPGWDLVPSKWYAVPQPPTASPSGRSQMSPMYSATVLRTAGLFDEADSDAADSLAQEFETIDVPRRTALFCEGEAADYLYVLLSGKVKLSRRSRDGREGLLALLGPAEQFGDVELLDGGPRVTTATVVADARLARLHKTALYRWLSARPQAAEQ